MMTEQEFMARARYGVAANGNNKAGNGSAFRRALADFLRSHEFHDVARAVEYALGEGQPT